MIPIRTRARNLILHGMLVAAGFILGALLAELFTALFIPQKLVYSTAPDIFFVRYDEEIGWVNKEGAAGTYQPNPSIPAFSIRINEFGMRGKSLAVQKSQGVKRILILGDSNTFGYGVEEHGTFSEVLATKLPKGYEVLNFGVFGYGTDQEALLFERDGLQNRPDTVVLAFSAGDLADNMSSINGGNNKPFFKIEGGRLTLRNVPVPISAPFLKASSRPSALKNFFYQHSHLYRLVLKRLTALNLYMVDSVREMSEKEGINSTLAIINGLNNMCRANGCRFMVLLISHGEWVAAMKDHGKEAGYYSFLKKAILNMGIPVVDTTDHFVSTHSRKEPLFFPSDPVHLNARGNTLAAEILYQELIRQGLRPKEQ